MGGEILLLTLKVAFVAAAVGGFIAADSIGIFDKPDFDKKPEILNFEIKKDALKP